MKCIAIFGPTASGKSSLAYFLAKELNGVIISVDSMQIYRGMDIGTAKPSKEEMEEVPHKLIDICDPSETFSVYDFKRRAEEEIRNAHRCKKVPILVGGTGLYFDSLFSNTDFGDFEIPSCLREEIRQRLEKEGAGALLEELRRIDPRTASNLHEKDHKRIVRGLEVYYGTGKTLTSFKEESHGTESEFHFLKLHLVYESRDRLYDRINKRVDQMLLEGLEEEARSIYDQALLTNGTASQAIGYKELIPYLSGEKELRSCIEILKQKTRNYAKRQITWFKRYSDAHCIVMDTEADPGIEALRITKDFLKEDTN